MNDQKCEWHPDLANIERTCDNVAAFIYHAKGGRHIRVCAACAEERSLRFFDRSLAPIGAAA